MEKENTSAGNPPDTQVPPAAASKPPEPASPALAPEWRHTMQPVFVVEDSFYRSRTPSRPIHWSIAWSDLMMTMFILFLVLFAHLRTHQEILAHGRPNRVADATLPVQADTKASSLVFHPISQDVSRQTVDRLPETPAPQREQPGADILIRNRLAEEPERSESITPIPDIPQSDPIPPPAQGGQMTSQPSPDQIGSTEHHEQVIGQIFDLSKLTLANEKLERFASVELVPDKTMRIILTGDLLFGSGQVELTPAAIESLKKLAPVIKKTPYMINVIGHTDDRPVKTARFPSNWELSLARAGRVARFLIEDTGLPATQFSVSGYSSFRPVAPNTSDENRRANRRVEIVLSKEPPLAVPASPANLPNSTVQP